MSNLEVYYSKHWIKPGLKVIHIDLVRKLSGKPMEGHTMNVRNIVFKNKDINGKMIRRLEGVRCYWYDTELKHREEIFFTRDLVPYDVARAGLLEVDKWLKRNIDE